MSTTKFKPKNERRPAFHWDKKLEAAAKEVGRILEQEWQNGEQTLTPDMKYARQTGK